MGDKIKAVIRMPQRMTAAIGGRDTTPAKWKGEWQAEETYAALQKVSRAGSSFVCIKACVGVDPALDVGEGVEGECWLLIAKRGDQGAPFTFDMFTAAQLAALRGPEGPSGPQGEVGPRGEIGPRGEVGPAGQAGPQGEVGPRGEIGQQGPAGPRGEVGPAGKDGERGPAGPQGPAGPAGPQGPQGERGPAGPAGSGTGDMTSAVYDPTGKAQDIFQYVDDKTKDVTADEVTFADGQTFQQKYDSGELTGPAGKDGQDGQPGAAGKDGQNGSPGADGVSPTVSVAAITGGHRITITDKNGSKTVDVMDGSDGADGPAGADGAPGAAGKDATINGVNALTIAGNGGVAASQSGSQLDLSVAGTFAGQAVANSAGQTPGTKLIRNSKLMAATAFDAVTDWSSHITNGEIAWRYE